MGINYFGVADYIAVGGTLLFSLFIGLYYALGKQTNEEMLVGGRSMNPIPIAASMLVTYLSAITLLGYPAEVYSHGIQIFLMTLLSFVCIPLSTVIFVKTFYHMKLTSIYEYLEWRFDSIVVRWMACFTFILQILLINGVALYAPSIALEAIVGLPVWLSIVGIGFIGTVYTSFGGIKAVVWTDCFQFVMIAIGMFSIVTRGFWTAGGIVETFKIANEKERLVLFDFTIDPFQRHNFWNFVFGYGFAMIALYGTHQPQVQRYCSLPSVDHAIKALLLTIPFSLFTMGLVVMTGLSIFATYSGCCPILLGKIARVDQIVPYFVTNELSFIPGLMGIFVSCIFSAVLSTISSTLNSLAAVTWQDFLSKMDGFKTMAANKQAMCLKLIAVLFGIISVLLAFGAQYMGQIFQIAMTAIGATAGGLVGVFICALFIPLTNKWGAISGMGVSLTCMIYLAVQAFLLQRKHASLSLPSHTDLDSCPPDTDFSNARNLTVIHNEPLEFEWPEKLYTLSYILYPFVGTIICTTIAVLLSVLTGGHSTGRNVPRKYLHPWVQHLSDNDEADKGKSPVFNNNEYPYRYDKVDTSAVPVLITANEKMQR